MSISPIDFRIQRIMDRLMIEHGIKRMETGQKGEDRPWEEMWRMGRNKERKWSIGMETPIQAA